MNKIKWHHASNSDLSVSWWERHFNNADAWVAENNWNLAHSVIQKPDGRWRVTGSDPTVRLWYQEKAIAEFDTLEEAKRYVEVLVRMSS